MALEITSLRVAAADRDGKAPGPEASILKIKGTEIQQGLTELMMEAVGPYALPHLPMAWGDHWIGAHVGPDYAAPLAARYFNYRKTTHLRRLERDPAQHHRADGSGTIGASEPWTSISREEQQMLKDSVNASSTRITLSSSAGRCSPTNRR